MAMMTAARLHGIGDVRVGREEAPVAGPGELLVRVTAVGLCGSDLHWFAEGGIGDAHVGSPLVLGHEMAGVVVGGDLDGTPVALDPARPCGRCEQCLEGHRNLCPAVAFAGHGAMMQRADDGDREIEPDDTIADVHGRIARRAGEAGLLALLRSHCQIAQRGDDRQAADEFGDQAELEEILGLALFEQLADAAAMEAETASRVVTADMMKQSPGVAKAWVKFNGTGTIAINASYGVSGITDLGAGTTRITMSTAMSSTNYCVVATCSLSESLAYIASTTTFDIETQNSGGTNTDASEVFAAVFGDQ